MYQKIIIYLAIYQQFEQDHIAVRIEEDITATGTAMQFFNLGAQVH